MCALTISLVSLLLLGAEPPKGHLVIAGGGPTPREVFVKILEMAGGGKAHVVVVPQASRDPEAGQRIAAKWQEAGAREVVILDPSCPKIALAAIETADLIWVRGGSQTLLMEALAGTGLPEAIRARFRAGAIVGGTSAGAAVMSSVMIAGWSDGRGSPARLAEGLGLWPDVVVDQHFLRRNRLDRLKGVVLQHPDLVGIGIDESTAVVVTGRQFEVIGDSQVVVIDARKLPHSKEIDKSRPAPATVEVAPQYLKRGMKFDLDAGLLVGSVASGG